MIKPELRANYLYFCSGALAVLILLFLTGAKSMEQHGRYEMEVVVRDRSSQIYVLDTTSGAVKWVDSMNTPFEQLK